MAHPDLPALLATSVLEPIDAHTVSELLSAAPFVTIPGVANSRDLGGLPIINYLSDAKKANIRRMEVRMGRLFRSAQLNSVTNEGREKLSSLNIGAIFDLRTSAEVLKYARLPVNDPNPSAGLMDFKEEGIQVYHVPMQDVKQLGTQEKTAMLLQYAPGDDGLLKLYEGILEIGGDSFGKIMRYLLEQTKLGDGGQGCLWHCYRE